MLYIGIDVGGTTAKAGVVDENGHILVKSSCKTGIERGFEDIAADMAALCHRIVRESGHTMDEIAAAGVGIPGEQSPKTGLVALCNNLGWVDVPLKERLCTALGVPVYVDNDANVAALAESVFGASRDASSSILVTLGTGVGGGIVVNGKILTGAHGAGGEIGHIHVDDETQECCGCGNQGCLEQFASATGIARLGREALEASDQPSIMRGKEMSAKLVFDSVKEGDELAIQVAERFGSYLGKALAGMTAVLDPEIIVVGGGVSKAGEILLDYIRKYYKPCAFKSTKETPFALAELGNDAGIYGCAKLILG